MAKVQLRLDNGLNTSGDPLRLGEGFLRVCKGAIYMPDDPDRLHKIPGRTEVGDLPAATSTADIKGLVHLQYENATDQFVLAGNSSLYEADVVTSSLVSGNWTQISDQQGTPVAYPYTGSYLKAIPDGDNGWIMWTGTTTERPLIREQGGHSWLLGMLKPLAPTLATVTSQGGSANSEVRPTAGAIDNSGTITVNGDSLTMNRDWWNPANAYDTDIDSYAICLQLTDAGVAQLGAVVYSFTEAGTIPANYNLYMRMWGLCNGNYPETAYLHIQVSYAGDVDGSYSTVYSFNLPQENGPDEDYYRNLILPLTSGGTWANLKIRAVFVSDNPLLYSTALLYDIFAQDEDEGSDSAIDSGTYYYSFTEVFEIRGDRPRVIESPPSTPIPIVLAGTEYGVKLTFDTNQAETNTGAMGVTHDPDNSLLHYRNVYRTTKTGIWPDLGFIASVPIANTTYTDLFTVGATTLGSPGINVVYETDVAVPAAEAPPPFRDAVLFQGTIVAIPQEDPFSIIWSLPGQPHYYPSSQEARLTATDRNDELQGVSVVGDSLLVFSRTQVRRIRRVPVVDQANFNARTIDIETLSPNEGLAGGPLGHTIAYSQKGHAIAVWVSDNGLYMSDGALVSEGGMGVVKLSVFMDWRKEVDVSQLSSAKLYYDSILQIISFDYVDNDANDQVKYFHVSPHHWVASGQDQSVPKITGPHTQFAVKDRAFGEFSSERKHWVLDATNKKIYNERTGTDLSGTKIVTHVESGLDYLGGSQNEFHIYEASVPHSDWGPSETGQIYLETFSDPHGISQSFAHKDLRLNGIRETQFFVNRGGQAVRMIFAHEGNTISDGSSQRAIGPLMLDADSLGETE